MFRNECSMFGQRRYGLADTIAYELQELIDLSIAWQVGERMLSTWPHALSRHDLQPGDLGEEFVGFTMDAPFFAEEFHLGRQRIGDAHTTPILPEGFVATIEVIVQNQKIANALELEDALPVVLVSECSRVPMLRKKCQ